MAKAKRYSLPKRFNVALSEDAYHNLRSLNAQWGLGNNYLLTVLLENLDDIANSEAMERAFTQFIDTYGAPNNPPQKKTR